jgi:hypothetical protein
MAVGKIRKISSWTMLVVVAISLVIFGLFYFGGVDEPYGERQWKNPSYTEELLIWSYIILSLCILGMALFAIVQFATSFTKNIKKSLMSVAVLGSFALLMVLAYSIGDATPLPGINKSSAKYNVDFWLKVTDMWIYTVYILMSLSTLLIIAGSIKKALNK